MVEQRMMRHFLPSVSGAIRRVARVINLGQMSEADRRAYIIADDKLAEAADWSTDLLRSELSGLIELGVRGRADWIRHVRDRWHLSMPLRGCLTRSRI